MLSILVSNPVSDIIEEVGGREIAYDPKSKLLLYVSPSVKNYSGLSSPESANQYFKILNGPTFRKSNVISRIGFRTPTYELHNLNKESNVYLKPETIQNMVNLLNQPYAIPNNPHEQREWADYLAVKNKQIEDYNQQNVNKIPTMTGFNNWQAAIIHTNRINGFEPHKTLMNDSRFVGEQGLNKNYLPFNLALPDYSTGLPASEEQKRQLKSEYRTRVGYY